MNAKKLFNIQRTYHEIVEKIGELKNRTEQIKPSRYRPLTDLWGKVIVEAFDEFRENWIMASSDQQFDIYVSKLQMYFEERLVEVEELYHDLDFYYEEDFKSFHAVSVVRAEVIKHQLKKNEDVLSQDIIHLIYCNILSFLQKVGQLNLDEPYFFLQPVRTKDARFEDILITETKAEKLIKFLMEYETEKGPLLILKKEDESAEKIIVNKDAIEKYFIGFISFCIEEGLIKSGLSGARIAASLKNSFSHNFQPRYFQQDYIVGVRSPTHKDHKYYSFFMGKAKFLSK